MASIPPYNDLLPLIATKNLALQYLKDHNVIEIETMCDRCGQGTMAFKNSTQYRCKKNACRHTKAVFKGE